MWKEIASPSLPHPHPHSSPSTGRGILRVLLKERFSNLMDSSNNKVNPGLFQTLRSVQFGITILIVISVVSVIGTIIPQGRSSDFYSEQFSGIVNFLIKVFRFDITYSSPLFIGLVCLFGLNLFLCSLKRMPSILRAAFKPDITPGEVKISHMPVKATIKNKSLDEVRRAFAESGIKLRTVDDTRLFGEKGKLGYLGSTIVHVSILIFLLGGLVSMLTGQRGHIVLEKGLSSSEITLFDESTIPLGFEIKLNQFDVEFYQDFPGRPKSFKSSVTVSEPGKVVYDKDITVNHPLMTQGFTIFQSSYGVSKNPQSVSEDDTVKVGIKLKGMPEEIPPIVTLDMVQGKQYSIPGFGDSLEVRLDKVYRDFKRTQTESGEVNPAIKVDVLVNGETKWSIFAFRNFPELNMPMDQEGLIFMFTMLEIVQSGGTSEPEFYTVLGVVRDKGNTIMLIGAILMMLGMFFSFYVRPKRIWALQTEGNVLIGATTKGDHEPLRNFVNKTVKNMQHSQKQGDKQ